MRAGLISTAFLPSPAPQLPYLPLPPAPQLTYLPRLHSCFAFPQPPQLLYRPLPTPTLHSCLTFHSPKSALPFPSFHSCFTFHGSKAALPFPSPSTCFTVTYLALPSTSTSPFPALNSYEVGGVRCVTQTW